jgi:hypothetical protein
VSVKIEQNGGTGDFDLTPAFKFSMEGGGGDGE